MFTIVLLVCLCKDMCNFVLLSLYAYLDFTKTIDQFILTH